MKQRLNPWEYVERVDEFAEFAVAEFDGELAIIAEYNDDGTLVTIEDISDDFATVVAGNIGNKSLREMRVITGWYRTLQEVDRTIQEVVEIEKGCNNGYQEIS